MTHPDNFINQTLPLSRLFLPQEAKLGQDGANGTTFPIANNYPVVGDDLDSLLQDIDESTGQANGFPGRSSSLADLKGWDDENMADAPTFTQINRALVQGQQLVRVAWEEGGISTVYRRISASKSWNLTP